MSLVLPVVEFLIGCFLLWWGFNAIIGEYKDEEDPALKTQVQITFLLTLGLGLMLIGIVFFVNGL